MRIMFTIVLILVLSLVLFCFEFVSYLPSALHAAESPNAWK